jgi:hypothetical protein
MKVPTIPTTEQRQRPRLSILAADHFARVGGADLSASERQLVEDFRQMHDSSRRPLAEVMHKVALRDREERAKQNTPGLRLVGGEV